MLFVFQLPRVEIAPGSWAHDLLREGKNVRMPRGLARWGGFGDLRKARLPEGDEEIRVWAGFGLTNLNGFILRKRAGSWTATRLTGGLPGATFRSKRRPFAAPKSGWPVFWRRAGELWTLPDDATLPQRDRALVLDGMSYLVETQRKGLYRAYVYNNPDAQKTWPTARRMAAIAAMLEKELPFGD